MLTEYQTDRLSLLEEASRSAVIEVSLVQNFDSRCASFRDPAICTASRARDGKKGIWVGVLISEERT